MNVIKFPGRSGEPPKSVDPGPLSETIEAAAEVHGLILEALRCAAFRDRPEALKAVLPGALGDLFGPDFIEWAQMQFEMIYGVDPSTFIDHLSSYQNLD
jgi:hypothetical protein